MTWGDFKLGEIVSIKHGYAFKGEFFSEEPTNDILLTPGNFKIGGGFKDNKLKYYSGEIPLDYVLSTNDVVVTMTDLSKMADTLGYSAKIPKDTSKTFLHNQRIGLVKQLTDKFELDFLYWLMRTEHYQKFVAGSATGATVKHTSPSKIYAFKFKAPSNKTTQQKIAQILSAYDDLIENNLKRIKLLEEMAQITYEQWFVRMKFPNHETTPIDAETGLPEGWKYSKLSDEVELIRDSILPSTLEKSVPYIGLEHMPRKSITLSKYGSSNDISSLKTNVKKGDILFGKIRPYFHKVGIALKDCITSTDNIVVRPKAKNNINGIILQTMFSKAFVSSAVQSSNGTKMPRANWKVLAKHKVIIPDMVVSNKFSDISTNIISSVSNLSEQNQRLKEARDILLPRLMTGMIDVDKIKLPKPLDKNNSHSSNPYKRGNPQ